MVTISKTNRGFTIVELLIVIIVIAILSAVGVVAYNGIQKRAANSAMLTAKSQLANTLNLYKTKKGEYPTVRKGDIPGLREDSVIPENHLAGFCLYNNNATKNCFSLSNDGSKEDGGGYNGSRGYIIGDFIVNLLRQQGLPIQSAPVPSYIHLITTKYGWNYYYSGVRYGYDSTNAYIYYPLWGRTCNDGDVEVDAYGTNLSTSPYFDGPKNDAIMCRYTVGKRYEQ